MGIIMADAEHLKILKQGVEIWNRWRNDNPSIVPQLQGADLHGAKLPNVDFADAKLEDANLQEADFSHANFQEAWIDRTDCLWTNFQYANLMGTFIQDARLPEADLRYANLSGAHILHSNLSGAKLKDTDFSNAELSFAIFGDNDLSVAKGLDSVEHLGPSIIGTHTLYLSKGNIPDEFLRGAGLPDNLIAVIPALFGQSQQYHSCFISYSHHDKKFARRLYHRLQQRGVRCWLDEKQMLPGDDIYEYVNRGISHWDKILLCCSQSSLSSWWVDNEIDMAFAKEQKLMRERGRKIWLLIPLNLDGYMFSDDWNSGKAQQVKSRIAADFMNWENDDSKFDEQFQRLLRALEVNEGDREAPPPSKL
jgi:hypothetical protein